MFKIKPYAGQTYTRPYADHNDIRAYLGWGRIVERTLRFYDPNEQLFYDEQYTTLKTAKLPMGFQGWTMVPLTDGREAKLICLPGNPSSDGRRGKSSAHRCFAVCPDCGTHVPAGRTHQHKCK